MAGLNGARRTGAERDPARVGLERGEAGPGAGQLPGGLVDGAESGRVYPPARGGAADCRGRASARLLKFFAVPKRDHEESGHGGSVLKGSDPDRRAEPGRGSAPALTPAQSRMARAALIWSLEQAGAAAGVSRRTVLRFERDRRDIRAELIADLRRAYEAAGVRFIEAGADAGGVVPPALKSLPPR